MNYETFWSILVKHDRTTDQCLNSKFCVAFHHSHAPNYNETYSFLLRYCNIRTIYIRSFLRLTGELINHRESDLYKLALIV